MTKHYRQEYVKCGKKNCGSCPHGPYLYSYERIKGRLHKKYCGKCDPGKNNSEKVSSSGSGKASPLDDIFNRRLATRGLAEKILGLVPGYTAKEAKAIFRELTRKHHPDRGGDEKTFKRVAAAWSFLSSAGIFAKFL